MTEIKNSIKTKPALRGRYRIDPAHTHIGFAVRHAVVTTVRRTFTEFTGTAVIDVAVPERSEASVAIDVAPSAPVWQTATPICAAAISSPSSSTRRSPSHRPISVRVATTWWLPVN